MLYTIKAEEVPFVEASATPDRLFTFHFNLLSFLIPPNIHSISLPGVKRRYFGHIPFRTSSPFIYYPKPLLALQAFPTGPLTLG